MENIEKIVKSSYSSRARDLMEKEEFIDNKGCCDKEGGHGTQAVSFGCNSRLVDVAGLKQGEIVLDLGSGPGHDALIASQMVGSKGKVIGVDFSEEMIALSKRNAKGYENVEFVLGDIKDLPIENESVDVVISNCVINLVKDKQRVFSEAYRTLRPNGRLVVADMITLDKISEEDTDAFCACIGGATSIEEYLHMMEHAGFTDVSADEVFRDTMQVGDEKKRYQSVVFKGRKPSV